MKGEREIWFHKGLWGYTPCHWKGLAVMAAIVLPTIAAVFVGQWLLSAIGVQHPDDWPFLLIFPAVIAGLIVAERHSE